MATRETYVYVNSSIHKIAPQRKTVPTLIHHMHLLQKSLIGSQFLRQAT